MTAQGFGGWIRPVSNRPFGEISEYERRYQNGEDPNVLDIIEIPLLQAHPHDYQTENHLIDAQFAWKKVGRFEKRRIAQLVDTLTGQLWIDGYSSNHGINDRIPENIANMLPNSLLLARLDSLTIVVSTEGGEFGNPKRKARAVFHLRDTEYKLVITDPQIERAFLKKKDGEYCLFGESVYVCISIGEPYNGFCYKLIASVIA